MRADLGAVALHYEVAGHGPNLMLSHGVIESERSWAELTPLLAEHFRVISYDARGRGGSTGSNVAYGYSELADDVEGLAEHLGLESFFHAGHSMGGRVALEHAIAHPGKVAGLAVISGRAEAPDSVGRAGLEGLITRVEAEGGGAGVDLWTTPADPYYERARSISAASPVEGTCRALRALVHMDSFVPHLATITVPTLIVAGDRDERYLTSARLMAEQIPSASLHVLAGVGHFPNLECPALLASALVRHFGSTTGPLPTRETP